jgi:hypothetical protein
MTIVNFLFFVRRSQQLVQTRRNAFVTIDRLRHSSHSRSIAASAAPFIARLRHFGGGWLPERIVRMRNRLTLRG